MSGPLKPCPFCGSAIVAVDDNAMHGWWCPEWIAWCRNCAARTARFDSKDEAIAAWNRRAEVAAQPDEKGDSA